MRYRLHTHTMIQNSNLHHLRSMIQNLNSVCSISHKYLNNITTV